MNRKQRHLVWLVSGAILYAGTAVTGASASPVDIQLNVGTQPIYVAPGYPPMAIATPPLMVWLSNLGVYAAYGASQPIFYQGSTYYYYYGNRWWAGPGYRGPWRPIVAPPPALRHWNYRDWQNVQRDARRHYRDPQWRHFRPTERPQPPYRGPEQRAPGAFRGPEGHGPAQRPEDHGGPGRGHDRGHGPQGQGSRQGRN
ncbi:hypothetical protein [Acidithiobacillus ferrivorans]|uniref:hypothetical protein n=1 Tax=Acidithiobacillus ferrivorans TaxID=160808 RepID=UPI001C06BA3E|nr:hypothetical protein [Acidithiobacillus ferrivorans]MBU2851280.1 hypothetical protein [Acidithiobacillus ferrivorans]